ncbi:uncharacterized protein [Clytia hemisphaerica]|uniref:Uncharacterized protein n=1 Tax=Clytia hemisphaerica TaxID=252671 RepID=A0A7M5XDV6_9CNID
MKGTFIALVVILSVATFCSCVKLRNRKTSIRNIRRIAAAPQKKQDLEELVLIGVKNYNDLIVNLHNGAKKLEIIEKLTNVAKSLNKLNIGLDKEQQHAVQVILRVHRESEFALDRARVVISKLKSLCGGLILILGEGRSDDDIKFAIEVFMEEAKEMEKPIQEAMDYMTAAITGAATVEGEMLKLKSWVSKKKSIAVSNEKEIIKAVRGGAYGGAAVCLLTLVKPILAVIVCPITYGVVSGVIEGHTIKQIEKGFDKTIEEIEKMSKDIKAIGTSTNALVQKVKVHKDKVSDIRMTLHDTLNRGKIVGYRFKVRFYNEFKKFLNLLYKKCESYLQSKK